MLCARKWTRRHVWLGLWQKDRNNNIYFNLLLVYILHASIVKILQEPRFFLPVVLYQKLIGLSNDERLIVCAFLAGNTQMCMQDHSHHLHHSVGHNLDISCIAGSSNLCARLELALHKDCFHTRAKCVIWIWIWNAHFELKFERRYFGPCVRQITSRCIIWNAHFKWRSGGVFQLRISQITQQNNRMNALTSKLWFGEGGGGAELSDLLTTSAYIPRAAYVQKHRKCELRACLIGRVPRHSSPALEC